MKKIIDRLMPVIVKKYRLLPGLRLRFRDQGSEDAGIPGLEKKDAEKISETLHARLARLQELLYAEHKHRLLVVLQGMDTSGKDGTIRHVFNGVNLQGVRVANFKVPIPEESDHDYLWRIHKQTPRKGEIVIFNRSHYEDVVTTRVHGTVSPKECRRRYAQINDFERMLCEEGTTVLKFFLSIDKDEQKKRLEERLKDPSKNWKFNVLDVRERKFWARYLEAYRDALTATSTQCAPWFIIPSNKKWYRNLTVLLVIIEALERARLKYPKSGKNLRDIKIV
jgi:PPK2 family polyphosphate:nucleotide phosphotransferase